MSRSHIHALLLPALLLSALVVTVVYSVPLREARLGAFRADETGPHGPVVPPSCPAPSVDAWGADCADPRATADGVFTASFAPHGPALRAFRRAHASVADGSAEGALLLRIEGAVLPDRPAIRGLVFVLRPGNPLPTSPRDPGFVGYFALGNARDAGVPRDHIMELTPALHELAGADLFGHDRPLTVGVVGVSSEKPNDIVPVHFRRATLTFEP